MYYTYTIGELKNSLLISKTCKEHFIKLNFCKKYKHYSVKVTGGPFKDSVGSFSSDSFMYFIAHKNKKGLKIKQSFIYLIFDKRVGNNHSNKRQIKKIDIKHIDFSSVVNSETSLINDSYLFDHSPKKEISALDYFGNVISKGDVIFYGGNSYSVEDIESPIHIRGTEIFTGKYNSMIRANKSIPLTKDDIILKKLRS